LHPIASRNLKLQLLAMLLQNGAVRIFIRSARSSGSFCDTPRRSEADCLDPFPGRFGVALIAFPIFENAGRINIKHAGIGSVMAL
jgi:hypothetical protein